MYLDFILNVLSLQQLEHCITDYCTVLQAYCKKGKNINGMGMCDIGGDVRDIPEADELHSCLAHGHKNKICFFTS